MVRERLDAVLDRSNIPTWVDQTELRAELYKAVDRMLKVERGAADLERRPPKYCECPVYRGTVSPLADGPYVCTTCRLRLQP